MKKTLTTLTLILSLMSFAQDSGNANYGGNQYSVAQASSILTTSGNFDEMIISIKGIYNEKATDKLAVFSVLQLGKTAEEATDLIDERIESVISQIKTYNSQIDIVTDMISFVLKYEFEDEKRLFNPKTYNEKPSGFELRKNLIIKYKNTDDLNRILKICARNEIYDLAKVDYVSTENEAVREELQNKAIQEYNRLLANYSAIMNEDLNKKEKIVQEGYNTVYPMESYRNYQAFARASTTFDKGSTVNHFTKNTTQYYNAVLQKQHAFVVNPDITEPAMQVVYELTIRIKLKEDKLPENTIQKNNRYYIVTANGELKPLDLK